MCAQDMETIAAIIIGINSTRMAEIYFVVRSEASGIGSKKPRAVAIESNFMEMVPAADEDTHIRCLGIARE